MQEGDQIISDPTADDAFQHPVLTRVPYGRRRQCVSLVAGFVVIVLDDIVVVVAVFVVVFVVTDDVVNDRFTAFAFFSCLLSSAGGRRIMSKV